MTFSVEYLVMISQDLRIRILGALREKEFASFRRSLSNMRLFIYRLDEHLMINASDFANFVSPTHTKYVNR